MGPTLREIVDEYIRRKKLQTSRWGQGPYQHSTGPLHRWLHDDTQFDGKLLEASNHAHVARYFGGIPPAILDKLQHIYGSTKIPRRIVELVLNTFYEKVTGARRPLGAPDPCSQFTNWSRAPYQERQPHVPDRI